MSTEINEVLLIDDDEPTNYLHKVLWERSGLSKSVLTAQNAKEALEVLQEKMDEGYPLPNIIFLDIHLPAMDGWEFIEQYEEILDARKNEVKLIMLSTTVNPEDHRKAKELDVVFDFRSKPLTPQAIQEIAVECA